MTAPPLVTHGNPLHHPETKVREAILEVLACVGERINGTLELDFKEGVPQRCARRAIRHFGSKGAQQRAARLTPRE